MATEMGRTTRRTTFCFVIWRLLFRELVDRGCVVLFRASPPSLSRSKAVPKFPLNSRSRMISFSWKLARYFRLSLFALGPTLLLRPASSTDFYIFCCRFFVVVVVFFGVCFFFSPFKGTTLSLRPRSSSGRLRHPLASRSTSDTQSERNPVKLGTSGRPIDAIAADPFSWS